MTKAPLSTTARIWWYRRRAQAGDTNAQYNLGLLLVGQVDPPELSEARTWLTRAAQAGNTHAQLALGGCSPTGWIPRS